MLCRLLLHLIKESSDCLNLLDRVPELSFVLSETFLPQLSCRCAHRYSVTEFGCDPHSVGGELFDVVSCFLDQQCTQALKIRTRKRVRNDREIAQVFSFPVPHLRIRRREVLLPKCLLCLPVIMMLTHIEFCMLHMRSEIMWVIDPIACRQQYPNVADKVPSMSSHSSCSLTSATLPGERGASRRGWVVCTRPEQTL